LSRSSYSSGYRGLIEDLEEAIEVARQIGYPVIVKATAGGGGKGMRVANDEDELRKAIWQAQKEAETAFGNPGVYLEKYLEEPRHVEIQIIADKRGMLPTWENEIARFNGAIRSLSKKLRPQPLIRNSGNRWEKRLLLQPNRLPITEPEPSNSC
jgi:hypothetical protein